MALAVLRPWHGDECRLAPWGCERTPLPSGYCWHHEQALRDQGMAPKPGTHIRSLRQPPELARAVSEAAKKLGIPENQFINQACRYVCREAGIPVDEPADATVEDPFQ